jgi:signal transduction histidine kinase
VPKSKGLIKVETNLIKTIEDDLEMLEISVIDNGPGISTEDQLKLFKPFSKLDSNKELNPNGNGLGLNIC